MSLTGTPAALDREQITAAYFGRTDVDACELGQRRVQGVLLGGLFAPSPPGCRWRSGSCGSSTWPTATSPSSAAYLAVSTTPPWTSTRSCRCSVVVPVMAAGGYVLQRLVFDRTMGPDPLPAILVTFGLGVVIQNALLEHYSADSRRPRRRARSRPPASGSPTTSRSAGSRC